MSTGFIFDVDGTILDSMGIWMNVGELYLKDMGIKAESNLGEILFEMTMNEGAEYIQKKYNLNLTTEEICTGINNRVYKFYEKEAMPKPKVIDFIEQLEEQHKALVEIQQQNESLKQENETQFSIMEDGKVRRLKESKKD